MLLRHLASLALLAAIAGGPVMAAPGGPAIPDPAAVTAGCYVVEPVHTRVQFTVSHMGITNWYGDFTGATGTLVLDSKNPAFSKLEIALPVSSVTTTNATLDTELRGPQWMDAAGHPTVRFVSKRVVRNGPRAATVTGELTFHGVTKPVTLKAVFNGAGTDPVAKAYTAGFDATTTIRRSDFGMNTYV